MALLTGTREMQRHPCSTIKTLVRNQRAGVQGTVDAGKSVEEAGGYAAGISATPLVKHLCYGRAVGGQQGR